MYKILMGFPLYDDLSISKKKIPESAMTFNIIAMQQSDQNRPTLPLKNKLTPKTAGNKTIASDMGYNAAHKRLVILALGLYEYMVYIVGIKKTIVARNAYPSIFLEIAIQNGFR